MVRRRRDDLISLKRLCLQTDLDDLKLSLQRLDLAVYPDLRAGVRLELQLCLFDRDSLIDVRHGARILRHLGSRLQRLDRLLLTL